jgi:hypothetical protein
VQVGTKVARKALLFGQGWAQSKFGEHASQHAYVTGVVVRVSACQQEALVDWDIDDDHTWYTIKTLDTSPQIYRTWNQHIVQLTRQRPNTRLQSSQTPPTIPPPAANASSAPSVALVPSNRSSKSQNKSSVPAPVITSSSDPQHHSSPALSSLPSYLPRVPFPISPPKSASKPGKNSYQPSSCPISGCSSTVFRHREDMLQHLNTCHHKQFVGAEILKQMAIAQCLTCRDFFKSRSGHTSASCSTRLASAPSQQSLATAISSSHSVAAPQPSSPPPPLPTSTSLPLTPSTPPPLISSTFPPLPTSSPPPIPSPSSLSVPVPAPVPLLSNPHTNPPSLSAVPPPQDLSELEIWINKALAFASQVPAEAVLGCPFPTLRKIPTKLLRRTSTLLNHFVRLSIRDPAAENPWKLLLLIPRLLWRKLPRGGAHKRRQLTSALVWRLKHFEAGDFAMLYETTLASLPLSDHASTVKSRVTSLVRLGELSRAAQAAVNKLKVAVPASPNDTIMTSLEDLLNPASVHPVPVLPQPRYTPPPTTSPDNDSDDIDADPDAFVSPAPLFDLLSFSTAISTAPRGSGPGPSGWRWEHLDDIFHQGGLQSFLHLFLKVSTTGLFPESLRSLFFGGKLTALVKPNSKHRPIVAGEIFARAIDRAVVTHSKDDWAKQFYPHQLGIGVPGGPQSITHVTRAALKLSPDHDLLSLDAINAFNSISRHAIREAVDAKFPALSNWFLLCYAHTPRLQIAMSDGSVHYLESTTGVLQGTALGTFYFGLTVHQDYVETATRFPLIRLHAQIDDMYLMGPPEALVNATQFLVEQLELKNLRVENEKSFRVYAQQDRLPATYPPHYQLTRDGMIVCGSAVGTDQFERDFADRMSVQSEELFKVVDQLEDPQIQLLLLRYCAVPRGNHVLRTIPIHNTTDAVGTFDQSMLRSVTAVIGTVVPEHALRQARMPISLGGLGLFSYRTIAWAAYLGSIADALRVFKSNLPSPNTPALNHDGVHWLLYSQLSVAQDLLQQCAHLRTAYSIAFPTVNTQNMVPTTVTQLQSTSPKLQRRLVHIWHELECHSLKESVPATRQPRVQARLQALQTPHAGAFLQAIPTTAEFTIPPQLMQLSLCLRLGIPLPLRLPSHCVCGIALQSEDADGQHFGICARTGERQALHNLMVRQLADMFRDAGLDPRTEELAHALFPGFNNPGQKRIDVFLEADNVIGDFRSIHSYSQAAMAHPGSAHLQLPVAEKRAKYGELAMENNCELQVYVMNNFGGMGSDLLSVIKWCSQRVSDGWIDTSDINWSASNFRRYWTQRLNCFFTKRYALLVRNKALASMTTARGRFDFVEGVDGWQETSIHAAASP